MADENSKKITEMGEMEKKAIILEALQKDGYTPYKAAQLMNVTRAYTSQLNKKVSKGLLNPLANKARKSIKLLLEGQPVGTMTSVKGADVLAAAKMVMDRVEPITVKTENTNVSVSYEIKEDERARYKAALGIIDAEFELVEEKDKQQLLEAPTLTEEECIAVDAKNIQQS